MDSTQKAIERLERKIDALMLAVTNLIESLADEQEDPDQLTLDGTPAGRPRDESQSL